MFLLQILNAIFILYPWKKLNSESRMDASANIWMKMEIFKKTLSRLCIET